MKTNLFRKNMLPLLGRGLGGGFLLLWGLGGGGVLLAQTPNLLVCADRGYTLTNATSAVGATSYKWYEQVNGGTFEEVAGKTDASLQLAAKGNAGTYAYVRIASGDDCDGVASNTYTVVVLKPTTPVVTPAAPAVCAGTDVIFAMTSPLPGATYSWSGEDGVTTGDDNSTYTISGAAYGTKSVYAAASFTYTVGTLTPKTCVSDLSTLASAEVNPLPEVADISDYDVCGSGVKALEVEVTAGDATVTGTATITWYAENSTSSTSLNTGVGSATYSPTLTASDTYYVGAEYTDNGKMCASTLTPVDATITLYEGAIGGTEN